MPDLKTGRWLLVALAVVGIAIAVPAVSAHGDEAPAQNTSAQDRTEADWMNWMEMQITSHMGPDTVEWMESHMGVTIDEMPSETTEDNRGDHRTADDDRSSHGMAGSSHGSHKRANGNHGGLGPYGQEHGQ
ncbi:hypothetical protein [Halomicrococcus sp. NG-SE-24]|uniref:hypothetical protein n=1 Tax=Halomicrococcus sp. NG-SE-24 TaxID=3436928 RepID=UPI003D9793B5